VFQQRLGSAKNATSHDLSSGSTLDVLEEIWLPYGSQQTGAEAGRREAKTYALETRWERRYVVAWSMVAGGRTSHEAMYIIYVAYYCAVY
jgi:hypothetical protein